MTPVLQPFPDGEDVLLALLSQVADTYQTTPAEFEPPLIQVREVGGVSGRIDTRPVIEVACFGETYAQAKQMAAQCEQLILAVRGSTVPNVAGHDNGVLVDRTEVVQTPREIPYRDQEKRRKTATYRLIMRRPRS